MTRQRSTAFTTIHTEGGILPVDLLAGVAALDKSIPGLDTNDYHLLKGELLGNVITESWNRLTSAWKHFTTQFALLPDADQGTTLTRERWLLPLFNELQFGRLQTAKAIEVDAVSYPISHGWGHVPIHLVSARTPLDRRSPGVKGAAGASPNSMTQEVLNRSGDHLWAFVSNGLVLRVLRDNASLTRHAFVEFDLETMFADGVYEDFVVLWLICHQSRVEGDDPAECWLEKWTAVAAEVGTRAREDLRSGVESAIEALGAGFVAHPANASLKERLRSGDLSTRDYYRQLLRLIYRLLFLLVAEDRRLLHVPDAGDMEQRRYARFYSLSRIRTLASRRRGGPHPDLWDSLVVVFKGLSHPDGIAELGLPGLGSFLWSASACPDIDQAHIANQHLLAAVRSLGFIEDRTEKVLRSIDYRSLGTEELGAVYESLLEQHPAVNADAGTFVLNSVLGNERKTSGSYYTPTALTSALLEMSLDPLLDEAEQHVDAEERLLALKVIDPACGSGHFLTAAAQRIAARLATIRTGETSPGPVAVQHALRDVISRCVYGIDRNDMAVELCKVSLWLESVEPGKPLSFLDHHIVCGDALLGATPSMLARDVPDEAFDAVEGDDKAVASARKAKNRQQRAARYEVQLTLDEVAAMQVGLVVDVNRLSELPDDTPEQIARKARIWEQYQESPALQDARRQADAWCAAFLAPKRADVPEILASTVKWYRQDPHSVAPATAELIHELSKHYQLLHLHLAFPDVFGAPTAGDRSEAGWSGGFDLVLGNPPWETLSPDAKEFFAFYEPTIRFKKKQEQEEMIERLLEDPGIRSRWETYRRDLFSSVHFIKKSGRYRLFAPGNLGKGDFNVYRMFVETALLLAGRHGAVAQITPSGLYGGANAQAIRSELFDGWWLSHMLGLINKSEVWFKGIDATTRFAMYSARRGGPTEGFTVAFEITTPDQLREALSAGQRIEVDTVRAQSAEALAINETSGSADSEIADHLYTQHPAFGEHVPGAGFREYQCEIHMGSDRDRFGEDPSGLPLYEGRMIGQYDHRAKAYRSGRGRSAVWEELPFGSLSKAIVPQWFVPPGQIPQKVGSRVDRYRVAFCDVTRPGTERSLVTTIVPPRVLCGHSAPTFTFEDQYEWAYLPWLAVANSLTADFLIRKRVTLHVTLTVLDSLPMPRLTLGDELLDRLAALVLKLTCTGPEMVGFWNKMSAYGWCEPAVEGSVPDAALVDEFERAQARAELDVLVARHLFHLDRSQLEHIISTFPTLERNEVRRHGEFRTRRLILDRFDRV